MGRLSYIATLDEDKASDNCETLPPWTKDPTTFSCVILDTPKINQIGRRIQGELTIARLRGGDTVYYTDGAADPDTGRSSSAFVHMGERYMWRISDGCCSLRTMRASSHPAGVIARAHP